ncbi:MAG: AMP-binding protein, partial [Thermoanaerobaculales bacterium]|nr:AMP-binding protein [Thermoanaerobaculales bacterium]
MTNILSTYPATLPEALRRAAIDFPDKGIHIFDGRGRTVERRTYTEFWDLALDHASRLRRLGIAKHEPVVVALPTSWEWLISWWGVLLSGGWPVAASGAGAIAAAEAQFDKVDTIMTTLGARYVIASDGFRQQAGDHSFVWAAEGVLTLSELGKLPKEANFRVGETAPEEVAFLQLTSGSTGSPRAVMITHLGALHNAVASSHAIGTPHGKPVHQFCDAMVSWLPLYHDMGLVGSLLLPITTGLDVWLLRPPTFLARPNLWLEHLGAHGNTFVPSPNFGYQLCVERVKPEKLEGVDLSGWKAALTGAEMIRPETVNAFIEKF